MKAIFNVLETRLLLRRPGWLRIPSAPSILVSDSGFAVRGLAVPWDAVSRIRAWRGDPSGGAQLRGPGTRRQGVTLFERFTHG